jgi:acylphosphatase
VEVLACGEPDAVNALREWLRRGPPQARVTGVACETLPYQPLSGFKTR